MMSAQRSLQTLNFVGKTDRLRGIQTKGVEGPKYQNIADMNMAPLMISYCALVPASGLIHMVFPNCPFDTFHTACLTILAFWWSLNTPLLINMIMIGIFQ